MFELINLYTRDYTLAAMLDTDDSIDACYVATARVPVMDPRPEILVWGARSFVRTDDKSSEDRPVYVEGFACAVVHTVPRDTTL